MTKPAWIVAMDPAYTGNVGLAMGSSVPGDDDLWYAWHGEKWEACDWLSNVLLAFPPEVGLLVAESTAFGPSIARKLGIAVGMVEGFLFKMNLLAPDSRVDVSERTWRAHAFRGRRMPKGRKALKAGAVALCKERWPVSGDTWNDNAAEARLILEWAREKFA